MPRLVTKTLVKIDVVYSQDYITMRQTIRFLIVLERTTLNPKLKSYEKGSGHLLLMAQLRKTVCLCMYLNVSEFWRVGVEV